VIDNAASMGREQITSHSLSTTFSNEGKTSFLKPCRRNHDQICSIGFISGVYGGKGMISMLAGIVPQPFLPTFLLLASVSGRKKGAVR
jgi:hypothetical protein